MPSASIAVGERVVGARRASRSAGVGEARARADEHEPLDALGRSASAACSAIRPPIE